MSHLDFSFDEMRLEEMSLEEIRLGEMRICTRVCVRAQIHVSANEYVHNECLYVFLTTEFVFTFRLAYHILHALFISIKIIKK